MDWTKYTDRSGFSVELPTGWTTQVLPGPTVIVTSPDRECVALIGRVGGPAGVFSGRYLIEAQVYPGAFLFAQAAVKNVSEGPNGAAGADLAYRTPVGVPGRARVNYARYGDAATVLATGAPAASFDVIAPVLARIVGSYRRGKAVALAGPRAPKPSAARPANAPLSYTKFTCPQTGSFSVEVPQGWSVRGGLAHPMPGDRRPWLEARSPDGITILWDPDFPQNLCHFPGQPEGQFVPLAAGGTMLNLKPSAQRYADCYLANLGTRRLGPAKAQQRRTRPDVVALLKTQFRQFTGVEMPRAYQISAEEITFAFEGGGPLRIASLLSAAAFNGDYQMGMWAFWDASVNLVIAPAPLVARAQEAQMHMKASLTFTPLWIQLVQRDEAQIAANAQAANAMQWNWFAGQQAVHRAQTAIGETIVANYWSQQAANDSVMSSWEHNQSVNDRLAQNYDDALMDRQRLADDGAGRAFDVPAGYEYYWVDPLTDTIYGTTTNDPPDYANTYTLLRKL